MQRSGSRYCDDDFWSVDGMVRPVCRPDVNQRVLYNGQKRVNCIKFQSVALPNGLVGNLYGPMEGKWNESGMLASSDFLEDSPSRQLDFLYVFMVTQHIPYVSIYKHHLEELH